MSMVSLLRGLLHLMGWAAADRRRRSSGSAPEEKTTDRSSITQGAVPETGTGNRCRNRSKQVDDSAPTPQR